MLPPISSAVLLVDGYNMIGLWPHLREQRDHDGLEAARRALSEILANYSAFMGFDTRLIFDAQYQSARAASETFTQNLSILYTDFGQTADTYIEKTCATLRHEFRLVKRRLIVATSDRTQQLMVVGYGAEWMSAQLLAQEVESAARRCQQRSKPRQPSSGRFLASSLDAEAQKRLAMLRRGLS